MLLMPQKYFKAISNLSNVISSVILFTYLDKSCPPCRQSCDSTHLSLFYNVVSHKVCNHHLGLVVHGVDIYAHVVTKQVAAELNVSFRDQQ